MKKEFDAHYTPAVLANSLIGNCHKDNPLSIADFAAGFGALLEAAEVRYPHAKIFANDISSDCQCYYSEKRPNWTTSNIDFIDTDSIIKLIDKKSSYKDDFDIIFLNPPFSFRGGHYVKAIFRNEYVNCSPAFAFVINSLNFLAADGELVAILPASCLLSDRDKKARNLLNKYFCLTEERKFDKKAFAGCSVNTVSVRIRMQLFVNSVHTSLLQNFQYYSNDINIFRGKLSMCNAYKFSCENGHELVHTTNLREGRVIYSGTRVHYESSLVKGPCVIIPRVCRPTHSKITVLDSDALVVLSDCLIAIYPNDFLSTDDLKKVILNDWEFFKDLYTSTCAPYITLDRIKTFFNKISININVLKNGVVEEFSMCITS